MATNAVARNGRKVTRSPSIEKLIRESDVGALGQIVAGLADIAVVVGKDGIVVDVPHARDPATQLDPSGWRGRPFTETISRDGRPAVRGFLARLAAGAAPADGEIILHETGGPEPVAIRYGGAALESGTEILLVGHAVDAGASTIDFAALFAAGASLPDDGRSMLADLVHLGNDFAVIMDVDGRLVWGNDAFHEAAEISLVTGLAGRFLEDLVSWADGGGLDGMTARAAREGTCPPAPATLVGDAGTRTPVTIALTSLPRTEPAMFGAIMRTATAAAEPAPPAPTVSLGERRLADISDMLDRAGRVPLKGLVRETADMIERHCLEAALQLTGNNRAAAARALGISRQSLYQKLERYGLAGD